MFESSSSWIWRLYAVIIHLLSFGSDTESGYDYDSDPESDFQENPFCTVQQGHRGSYCGCRFPVPDSRDTYNLASIIRYQGFNFRPISLPAGQTVVVTNKIECVEDDEFLNDDDKNELLLARARPIKVKRSKKWFTLIDSEINTNGELVQRYATDRSQKTPAGRVVMLDVRVKSDKWYGEKDGSFEHDRSTKFFYQFI